MSRLLSVVVSGVVLLAGCASSPSELERVAKDWCLTIRASQVIPVYPLTEDVQPGDVFIVPSSIQDQALEYESKGFLSLSQLVTRLDDLPYDEFYADAYFTGSYGGVAHARPGAIVGPTEASMREEPVLAPRAAFPSYTFEVTSSSGLQLALPIQGVPVGLGLMGARKATGSVTIRDAYTYGLDGESMVRILQEWAADPLVRLELSRVARQTSSPVFLRVITRVFLTRGVTVSLANLDTRGGGADAGAAPAIQLLDLSVEDPQKMESAVNAYKQALAAISNPLGATDGLPGGAFRITQASRRAVTLDEDFDRPLVIGYRGFDVLVHEDGRLSAPIPSFATLAGNEAVLDYVRNPIESRPDDNSFLIEHWIESNEEHYKELLGYLNTKGYSALDPSDLIESGVHADLRAAVVTHFRIGM